MNEGWYNQLQELLANPALFDEGVEAARNACVAGASVAAAAITAAAYYDNPLTGVPALVDCMQRVRAHASELTTVATWQHAFAPQRHPGSGDEGYSPGFGFVSSLQAEAVRLTCQQLRQTNLGWPALDAYLELHSRIEPTIGALNVCGLAALAFVDRGWDVDRAERSYLMLRMQPAIVEAQLARSRGIGAFPFFSDTLAYEGTYTCGEPPDLAALMREVGLE